MTTTQNLPALIKEMQERARDKAERGYLSHTYKAVGKQGSFIPVEELDTLITDTHNATLEYVKGVIRDYEKTKDDHPEPSEVEWVCTDLIARLTTNPNQ